jgi:hypothetical protein
MFTKKISLGFALLFLVLFAIFVVAWERILGRSLKRLFGYISKSNGNNQTWSRIRPLIGKFSW